MSFKEKLRSKLKPISKAELQSFDESAVSIEVVHGKTQLNEIRLVPKWSLPYKGKLNCRWYNKTESNILEIPAVTGEYYQPSLADINTMYDMGIHIQITPELEGLEYTGMPIIREIGPIALSQETQRQANEILELRKATFFVEIKDISITGANNRSYRDAVISVLDNQVLSVFKVCHGELNDELLKSAIIGSEYPVLKVSRHLGNQARIQFSQEEYCVVTLVSNKLRDALCLLLTLIVAKHQSGEEKLEILQLTQCKSINLESKESCESKEKGDTEESKMDIQKTPMEVSSSQTPTQAQSHESNEMSVQLKGEDVMSPQIRSSQVLAQSCSPVKDKLSQSSLSPFTQSPAKLTASQLIQLTQLKKDVKALELQLTSERKQLEREREECAMHKQKREEVQERMGNLQRNYFTLEQECKAITEKHAKLQEEISYYRKEQALKRTKELEYAKIIEEYQQHIKEFKEDKENKQEKKRMGQQENRSPKNADLMVEKSVIEEKEKKQESLKPIEKNMHLQMEKMRNQIHGFSMLVEQYEQQITALKTINEHQEAELKSAERRYSSMQTELSNSRIFLAEKIEVKPKLEESAWQSRVKELTEENTMLRGLAVKDKKSTSRVHLKLELWELKRLVNKLTEELTEKEIALGSMKSVNRAIGAQLQKCEQCHH